MLRISRDQRNFQRLETPTLAQAEILERADLQEYIWNSPAEFFAELGEELFLIDKEVCPSETVADRIDLLAVDADGRVVVIELKRGNHKFQLLQAISYAAMVSKWTAEEVVARAGSRGDELLQFVEQETLNRSQRILLMAEAYDYEVLAAAEWLYETYAVEIVCARVGLARDPQSGVEYLTCSQIFPAKELAQHAIVRHSARFQPPVSAAERDAAWEKRINAVEVQPLRTFVAEEVAAGRERDSCRLLFRITGRRRWVVRPLLRKPYLYVRQVGHFPGEQEFWRERLSDPNTVVYRNDGELIFRLCGEQDVAAFRAAQTTILPWGAGAREANA